MCFESSAGPFNDILWQEPTLKEGNVDSLMFVVPNDASRLGRWGNRYAGDYDFIASTAALYPAGSVIWCPEIVAVWRPGEEAS